MQLCLHFSLLVLTISKKPESVSHCNKQQKGFRTMILSSPFVCGDVSLSRALVHGTGRALLVFEPSRVSHVSSVPIARPTPRHGTSRQASELLARTGRELFPLAVSRASYVQDCWIQLLLLEEALQDSCHRPRLRRWTPTGSVCA